jgi:hypothetical protein
MKNTFFLICAILASQLTFSQQNEIRFFSLEANYFTGSILEHNLDISHLIIGHPEGLILSYNRKTYGYTEVEGRYNFPDWGFTFIYQDLKNPVLGENYAVLAHFNWYFLNRSLFFGVGQGVAYASNPYDPDTNFNNNAYGSRLLATTMFRANYVKENLFKGFGFQAGIGLIHYSNGNFKAPNSSTNTLFFNAGVSYQFNAINFPELIPVGSWFSKYYAERIKYNVVLRTGLNEADVNGLGQKAFYVISAYADKRINYKSSFQLGADIFFTRFLIDYIEYKSIAFPESSADGDEDYKRVGVFIGHELRFDKLAFVSQFGYYVYWPFEYENRVYNRLGLKRYFYHDRIFAAITLKAHYAKAEAVEFGLGIRL